MSKPLSIQDALNSAGDTLAPRSDAAALEAEVLLAWVLGKPRSQLRARPEQALEETQRQHFFDLIRRRAAGEPIAYLTGHREFWSLDLLVNAHTLIPRPETELLVETALARMPRQALVADLGTGSGAIALAIAGERPLCRVIATDIDPEALKVASANAERLNIRNVEFREGAWFAPFGDERFDMIVSNPPYIAEHDPHLEEGDLPAEPRRALVAGPTGLEMIAAIAGEAPRFLLDQGWLLLEHGYQQGAAVAAMLRDAGYRGVQTWRDAAGRERVSGGQRG
jgi:release factor glutamine methyltransferase